MPKIAYSVLIPSGERVAFSLAKKSRNSPFWNARWRWNRRSFVRSTGKTDRDEAVAEGRRLVLMVCGSEEHLAESWFSEASAEVNRLLRDGQLDARSAADALSIAAILRDLGAPRPAIRRAVADVRFEWASDVRRVVVDVGLWLRISVEDRIGRLNVEWTQGRETTVDYLAAFLRPVFAAGG